MTHFYSVVFFLCFFIGQNIVLALGIDIAQFHFILSVLWAMELFHLCKPISYNNTKITMLILTFIFVLIKNITDESEGTRAITMNILIGPLAIAALDQIEDVPFLHEIKIRRNLFVIFLGAFILNSLWAIFERTTLTNIFEAIGTDTTEFEVYGASYFRSNAIHGHPLYNALLTATGMIFILTSKLKLTIKYTLWGLGMVALFCFNARTAILISVLAFFLYALFYLFDGKVSSLSKFRLTTGLISGIVALFYFLIHNNLGGRLFEVGYNLQDGSSQTRVEVWNIIPVIDLKTWLVGASSDEYIIFKSIAGIMVTENFWIDWLIRFGLLFVIIYVFLMYKVVKGLYKNYSKFDAILSSMVFWGVASCNNSLTLNGIALVIYLFLIDVFNPCFKELIIPHSLISKQEYDEDEDEKEYIIEIE